MIIQKLNKTTVVIEPASGDRGIFDKLCKKCNIESIKKVVIRLEVNFITLLVTKNKIGNLREKMFAEYYGYEDKLIYTRTIKHVIDKDDFTELAYLVTALEELEEIDIEIVVSQESEQCTKTKE